MQLRWPYPRIMAHRCGGMVAPENTAAGLRAPAARGFRGVEFDVMLSGEGTPLLIHDETWERTTDGRGRVAETTDAEIARLDAGGRFDAHFAGEPVPTFETAARLCRELGLAANVEIKPARGHERATGRSVAAAAARWRDETGPPPLLSSFSEAALAAAREAAPDLPRGLLVKSVPKDWRSRLERLGCIALHCDAKANATAAMARIAAEVPLVCYTVNDIGKARELLAAGIATLITDRIDLIPPALQP